MEIIGAEVPALGPLIRLLSFMLAVYGSTIILEQAEVQCIYADVHGQKALTAVSLASGTTFYRRTLARPLASANLYRDHKKESSSPPSPALQQSKPVARHHILSRRPRADVGKC